MGAERWLDHVEDMLTEWYRADPAVRALNVPALQELEDAILRLVERVQQESEDRDGDRRERGVCRVP